MGGGTDLAGPVFANTAGNCRLGSRVTQLDDTAKYPYPPSHLPTSSASLVISWEVHLKAGTTSLMYKSLHTRVQGRFVGVTATQIITLASDYSTKHSPFLRDVNEVLFTGCQNMLV